MSDFEKEILEINKNIFHILKNEMTTLTYTIFVVSLTALLSIWSFFLVSDLKNTVNKLEAKIENNEQYK